MLPSWFTEAETLKTEVLARLEKMSPEDRCRSPRPGARCATQVVAHLALVEETLVNDWYVVAQKAPTVSPNWRSALLIRIINIGLRTPLRVPTVPALEPKEGSELRDLSAHWGAVRERLRGTLPAGTDASHLWIMHPVFGPLSCQQMGTFLVTHLHHHLRHWPIIK